ncbi:MAG: phytanoyl-CoA dioxygenase family protein [Gammaproteobacteria bacterium]|nr:phytanoyl-CoA dioxygenase family protein [Gammaproteobacteria bacterium]
MALPQIPVEDELLNKWLAGRSLAALCRQFDQDGYLVFDSVLDRDEVAMIRDALDPFLDANVRGRNSFEGVRSNRIYAMLNKSAKFSDLVTHPLPLSFAEAELGRSCLLSACIAIQLNPGESVQPWHYDDAHLQIPRPRAAYGLSVFWAIDETNDENGATEVIPGSHRWGDNMLDGSLSDADLEDNSTPDPANDPAAHAEAIAVPLQPGSLMIAKGTLWHRGGANRSSKPRLIVTPQYCPGWSRQLENMLLAVSPENAGKLSKRARELLGYSIHPPFMGYVDGVHPQRVLPK